MKMLILLAVVVGAGLLGWNVVNRLSIDAIAMAIGLTLGVVAVMPSIALVMLAGNRNRTARPYDDHGAYIDLQPTYTPALLPYTPSDKQAQLAELRTYLAHLEALEVTA